jgi:ABC-type dipeptide/oligopeptide/nickel transport systems, permease components
MSEVEVTTALEDSRGARQRSKGRDIWRRIRKNKSAMVGLAVICVFVLAAIFANQIADYEGRAIAQNVSMRLKGPSAEHWFGTDAYGRDVFARIVFGARTSLWIGLVTTLVSVAIATAFGAVAGYYGGAVDGLIMRVMDTIMAIPPVLLALAIVAALGPGMTNMVIAMTVSNVPGLTRVIRSVILSVVGQDYIEAAKAGGSGDVRIMLRHVVPNAMGPIIVQATMSVSSMIINAAALSFLGMGIQPPAPEWGAMLAESNDYMTTSPYLVIIPGLAILFSALSINLFGDGLRDALDPKLKD